MNAREAISDFYFDAVFADGFDDAIIGVDDSNGERVVYSVTKSIDLLVGKGMSYEDAVEYLYYNVVGSHIGPNTPIWCNDSFF